MNTKDEIKLIHIDKKKLEDILNEAYGGDCVTIKSFNLLFETISFFIEESFPIEDNLYKISIVIETILKKYGSHFEHLIKWYPNCIDFITLPNKLKIKDIQPELSELLEMSEEYGVNYNSLFNLFYPNTNLIKKP